MRQHRTSVAAGGGRWPGVMLALALAALLAGCSAPTLPLLPWQQQAHGPTLLPDAQQVLRITAQGGDGSGDV
ncbi:MAG TPA: hypothetical protein VIC27_07810, partial [Ktedonobacterales bacterium]